MLAAFFQGITPRSSGFNTIDIGSMLAASQFFIIILMFIGAASGGTGGGIKINTLVVLILATIQTFRGGGQIHAFKRKIRFFLSINTLTFGHISLVKGIPSKVMV
nr:potassium transporter TrkG [Paenibacillus sp. MDMC362]